MIESSDQPASTWRRLKRRVGYVLGAALLIACVVTALRGGDWQRLSQAGWDQVAAVLAIILVTLLTSSVIFWYLTRPFEQPDRPIPLERMLALIAASTLLNYLPMRPGLIGRAAYLKQQYRIGYRQSVTVLLVAIVLSTLVYVLFLSVVLLPQRYGNIPRVVIAVGLVLVLSFAAYFVLNRFKAETAWQWIGGVAIALILRALEVVLTAIRLCLVFEILGHELHFTEAVIFATCGMFITLVGITPNGLGLREWLYGLIASSGFFAGDVEGGLQLGLQVALIDRAAEALVVVPAGLAGMGYLKSKPRRSRRG